MPPKQKRTKVECLVCNSVFDSDFRLKHNQKQHFDLVTSRKQIPYKLERAPKNPWEAARNLSITSSETSGLEKATDDAATSESDITISAPGTSWSCDAVEATVIDYLRLQQEPCPSTPSLALASLTVPAVQDNQEMPLDSDSSVSSDSDQQHGHGDANGDDQNVSLPLLNHDCDYPSDPALFTETGITPALTRELLEAGPCQPGLSTNDEFKFPTDDHNRSFHSSWYIKKMPNSLKLQREWLSYSPTNNKAYCFCCMMFAEQSDPSYDPAWSDPRRGFSNWKKGTQRICEHESSGTHIKAASAMAMTKHRLNTNQTINQQQLSAHMQLVEHNRMILRRLIDIILFLSKQNMAFRGHHEYRALGQPSVNEGNFLELCKLVAKYDAVLATHIFATKTTHMYLSPDIQNDLIHALSESTRNVVLKKISTAKFYSVIVDESRDCSRSEMCSISMRFVNEEGIIEEVFLDFVELTSTASENMLNVILQKLSKWNLPITLCRGQCYDGASNMAGKKSGLQQRIKEQSPLALFVHCCAHNLNLCLIDSCTNCTETITFFGTLERIYSFFTRSMVRLQAYSEACKEVGLPELTFKRLQMTRWSSRNQSVTMILHVYPALLLALENIQEIDRRSEVITEANGISMAMNRVEFILQLLLWQSILKEITILSKYLQSNEMDLLSASQLVKTTLDNVSRLRNNDFFDTQLQCAKDKASEWEITNQDLQRKRIRRKKQMPGESAADDPIVDAKDNFKVNVFFIVLDTLRTQLTERFSSFHDTVVNFSCLLPSYYESDNAIMQLQRLCETYKDDICNQESCVQEYKTMRTLYTNWSKELTDKETPKTVHELLRFLYERRLLHAFPSVVILMRIFLTIPASSAGAERSFSRMKLIKSYLRSSMSEERLSNLAILSIEREYAQNFLNYDKVIDTFAKMKQRRMIID